MAFEEVRKIEYIRDVLRDIMDGTGGADEGHQTFMYDFWLRIEQAIKYVEEVHQDALQREKESTRA